MRSRTAGERHAENWGHEIPGVFDISRCGFDLTASYSFWFVRRIRAITRARDSPGNSAVRFTSHFAWIEISSATLPLIAYPPP
jgi:hypothetical protein